MHWGDGNSYTSSLCCDPHIKLRHGAARSSHPSPLTPHRRTVTRSTKGALFTGGGIATLVRSSIAAKVTFRSTGVTERLDVRCTGRRGLHVTLCNIYRPSNVGRKRADPRKDDFRPEDLPTDRNTFIAGDFNLHHASWDGNARADAGGKSLYDWIQRSGKRCWNSNAKSSYTRVSGLYRSSPDLVIAPSHIPTKWRVLESPWGSDHLPVSFDVPFLGLRPQDPPPQPHWAWHLADWPSFAATMEKFATKVVKWSDPHESAAKFAAAIVSAGEKHVGRCRSSKKSKGWWTAEVSEAICRRNDEARRQRNLPALTDDDVAHLKSLQKRASDAVTNAKRGSLERLLETTSGGNTKAVYSFLRKADGRAREPLSCPLADDSGAPISDPRVKADALGAHYAKICGAGPAGPEHAPQHPKHQDLAPKRPPSSLHPSERELTQKELVFAMMCLSSGNSAGPDGVPTTLLLHLGPLARVALLKIFNISWRTGVVPACWRKALISPLPKPDKDPALPTAYRPIALTSNICKLLERILKERLTQLFEDPTLPVTTLRGCQAGFRRLRSTSEQVALFAQRTSDARGGKKKRSTVALFFDMEKAFDTISKAALAKKLDDMHVPERFRRWICAYLSDRIAAVVVDGVRGHYFCMRDGVPQGTVLSPMLFTCLLDDLAIELEDMTDVFPSLYADDIAVLTLGDTPEAAESLAQDVMLKVELFCIDPCLRLSREKTTMMSESRDSANLPPCIGFTDGSVVPHVKTQRFLGATLDPKLLFQEHLSAALGRFNRRLYLLRTLRDRDWGACKHLLRTVFLTVVLPTLTSLIGIFGPFLHAKQRSSIDRALHVAARLIIGCPRFTSGSKALWEAHLDDAATLIARAAVADYERFLRLPGTSGHLAATAAGRSTGSWLSQMRDLEFVTGVYAASPPPPGYRHESETIRAPLIRYSAVAPWDAGKVSRLLTLLPFIDGLSKKQSPSEQRELAAALIASRHAAWTIFTDGSLRDSTGGAGVVTYRGDDPDPISATAHGVGRCGSSYRTEMAALLFALTSLLSRDVKGTSVIIYTDSQSAVRKLCSGAAAAREEHDFAIWTSLRELTVERHCRITIQFVPGHAGLAGNELADSAAKRGLDILVPATRLSLTCAKSLFRRFINKHVRQRPADVYVVKGPPLRPPLSNPRLTHRGEVLAACIRTGQHTLIRTMDFGSGGYVSATCECGATRSLEHMLSQCSRTTEARARYLPHGNWRYAVLFHESKLLDFLVAAGHVPGPLSVYLTPSPPAAAAHATVAVAAAISAVLALA